jgi:hypothetical protein
MRCEEPCAYRPIADSQVFGELLRGAKYKTLGVLSAIRKLGFPQPAETPLRAVVMQS